MSKRLTIATYGCPSQPEEYYHTVKQYLEEKVGLTIDLILDTDRLGPSIERGDQNIIDIAFVGTRYGLDLQHQPEDSTHYSVLPVGAITQPPIGGNPIEDRKNLPGYWSVVLVRDDKSDIKSFLDLRGCKLAYSEQTSVSGATALLSKLKQSGEDASFFSTMHKCGDHIACIKGLVDMELEVAVVDSQALNTYLLHHPRLANKVKHVYTWGPHPPHPIIVNKKLDDATRGKVLETLLALHPNSSTKPGVKEWLDKLKPFGIRGFGTPDFETQDAATTVLEDCRKLSVDITYY